MTDAIALFTTADYVTLGLVCFVCGSIGFWFTRAAHNLASYFRGHRDGRKEEKCHTNALCVAAETRGCHKGRKAERDKALNAVRFDLTPRPKFKIY